MHILGSSHIISLQVYPQTILIVTHMYTNIHSHQNKTTQITWNHLLNTYNIQKCEIWTDWILLHLSENR